ncbi:MAG TPA: sulfite exporter TauE/SafE family protein [Bauldia sp.]|nr:sulfite exporter TauE/SafE family protein [Bauldia sp.]
MIADPWFYVAAVPAVFILGLSKGGFSALGLLTVPVMALAISPVQAAGITLPILVLSDIVALISYRRVFDVTTLKIVLPGAIVGVAVGWLTASWVTEPYIRLIVGVISIVFGVQYFLARGISAEPAPQNAAKGAFWGALAGFTSFVSHTGGPPYQVYAAPLRLEPRVFAGTSVLIFAVINAVKIPPYLLLGQFTKENMLTAAVLVPVAIPATLFGVWLVKRFDPHSFYIWIYVTILVVGTFLVVQSLGDLL